MRKKLAAATTALVAAFALCSAAVPAQAASLSGSGTQADPYLIANAEDLAQFRDIVNEGGDIYSTNAKLTADIDLQGSTWVPIGLDNASPFYGSFDGQGHVIRNMHVDMSNEESPAGLFSEVFGSIHNLGVLNATVTGTDMVGAIAGSIENSDDGTGLFNCWSDGGTVTGRSMVGGLVGNMRSSGQATITGSYNGNHVIGYENGIGGVVGWVYNASVIDSHNAGNVEAAASEYVLPHEIGGVIGHAVNSNTNELNALYNTGNVSAPTGTLVGGVVGNDVMWLSNAYNTGKVSGASSVGGVIGGTADDLHNVYNIGSVTAQDNQYGAISGTSDGAFNSSNLYYLNGTAPSAFAEGQDGDAHAKSIADFENLAVVLHALYSAAPEIWLNTRGQVGEPTEQLPWLQPILRGQIPTYDVHVQISGDGNGSVRSANGWMAANVDVQNGDTLYVRGGTQGAFTATCNNCSATQAAYQNTALAGTDGDYSFGPVNADATTLSIEFTKAPSEEPTEPNKPEPEQPQPSEPAQPNKPVEPAAPSPQPQPQPAPTSNNLAATGSSVAPLAWILACCAAFGAILLLGSRSKRNS